MAVAFSSSVDDVMSRQVAVHSPLSYSDVTEEFDVLSTAAWIREQDFKRVCGT